VPGCELVVANRKGGGEMQTFHCKAEPTVQFARKSNCFSQKSSPGLAKAAASFRLICGTPEGAERRRQALPDLRLTLAMHGRLALNKKGSD
jgi:hypothetical protein